MFNDIYCVLQFEDEKGEELRSQFLLPYAPYFFNGQVIYLAESIDKSFVGKYNWDVSIELNKCYEILKVIQHFEHKYSTKMSTSHFITLTLREIKK